MMGARQKGSFMTAREYEGRSDQCEPKGRMGARQKESLIYIRSRRV